MAKPRFLICLAVFAQVFITSKSIAAICFVQEQAEITRKVSSQTYQGLETLTADLLSRSLKKFGKGSECHAEILQSRGLVLQLLARPAEAEPLLEESEKLLRKLTREGDPRRHLALNNLGSNRFWMRRYKEAARLHEEALTLREKTRPGELSDIAESLHNLADAYRYLRRPAKHVRKLYENSIKMRTQHLGAKDPSIGQSYQNLASTYEAEGDYQEAAEALKKALGIYKEKLRKDDIRIASVSSRLAVLAHVRGELEAATKLFESALRIQDSAKNIHLMTLAATLDDYCVNLTARGKLKRAKKACSRALSVRQGILPGSHPTIARTLSNMSEIAWLQANFQESLKLSRQASAATLTRNQLDPAGRFRLHRHVRALWWSLSKTKGRARQQLLEEAFEYTQRAARSDTAAAVTQMSQRFSAKDRGLASHLKQLADLNREQLILDERLSQLVANNTRSSRKLITEIRERQSEIEEFRRTTNSQIRTEHAEFFRLTTTDPLTIRQTQELLGPKEGLLLFLEGPNEIYVWALTAVGKPKWTRAKISRSQLVQAVAQLRASLNVEPTDSRDYDKKLFNLGLAHELFNRLLGSVHQTVRKKSELLVVRSGALTTLPIHLLVRKRPKKLQPTRKEPIVYAKADWLIKSHSVTVLSSVESLQGRARPITREDSRQPLIGFADPQPNPSGGTAIPASIGRERLGSQSTKRPIDFWKGDKVDIAGLRNYLRLEPLKETVGELKEVASFLGAKPADLFTGASATERAFKQADLSRYRTVYLATHGFVAGKWGSGEPSLALTVPDNPTAESDGLLTASEIAQLSLNADLVVLSACDTAAGDSSNAEGLSGLARAFFHAGARQLLVSHWAVDSIDTKKLMISIFRKLSQDKATIQSALRDGMLQRIAAGKKDKAWDAYPGRWAPFELVGSTISN